MALKLEQIENFTHFLFLFWLIANLTIAIILCKEEYMCIYLSFFTQGLFFHYLHEF